MPAPEEKTGSTEPVNPVQKTAESLARSQWPLILVLAVLVVALLVVAADHFRRGSVLFAGGVVLAFFLRLWLPDEDAGWLVVRNRAIDLTCLAVLGVGLSVFALIVPPPP